MKPALQKRLKPAAPCLTHLELALRAVRPDLNDDFVLLHQQVRVMEQRYNYIVGTLLAELAVAGRIDLKVDGALSAAKKEGE